MKINPKNIQHCSLKSPLTLDPLELDFVDDPETPEYKFFSSFISFAVSEFPYLSPIHDKYFSTTEKFEILDLEREFNDSVADQAIRDSNNPNIKPNITDTETPKFASKPLLKHILSMCYHRAVFDPKRLNKYKPFSARVYGEMSFEAMDELIKIFGSDKNIRFIDLGSGVGQVVMQVSASVQCDSCIGVEISDVPYSYSIELSNHFKATMAWFGKYHSPFELLHADFTQPTYSPLILKSNFIFANNVMYGCELNNKLSAIFRDVPDGIYDLTTGSQIFSSFPFIPKNFRLSRRTANEFGAVSHMRTINLKMEHMVSWTPKAIPLFQHIVDNKALLELVSNLNGKDLFENFDFNQFNKHSKYVRKRAKSLSNKLNGATKKATNGHRSQLVGNKQNKLTEIDTPVSVIGEAFPEDIKDEPAPLSSFATISPIKESVTNSTLNPIINGIFAGVPNGISPKLSPLSLNGFSEVVKILPNGVKEAPIVISSCDSGSSNSFKAKNNLTLLETEYAEDKEESDDNEEPESLKDTNIFEKTDFVPILPPEKDLTRTSLSPCKKHNDITVPGVILKESPNNTAINNESLPIPRPHQTVPPSLQPLSVPLSPTTVEEPRIAEILKDLVPDENITDFAPKLVEVTTPNHIVDSQNRKRKISSTTKQVKNKMKVNGVNGMNGITLHTKPEIPPVKNIPSAPKIVPNIPNGACDYKLIPIPRQTVSKTSLTRSSPQQKNALNLSAQNKQNIKPMNDPVKTRPLNSKISDIDTQLMQVIQNLDLAYANVILTVNEASKVNKCSPAGLTGIAYKMYHQIHEQIDTFKEFTLNSLNEFLKPTYSTETFTTHPDLE